MNEVLIYDLAHNGMTHALTGKERDQVLAKQPHSLAETPNFDALRDAQLAYYLQTGGKECGFQAKLYTVLSNSMRVVETALTGDEKIDRRSIHKLADTIFEAFFQKCGIATSRILFTIKKKTGQAELCVCDYDGQNMQKLGSFNALIATPQWIPSHKNACIFVSYEIGQPKIYCAQLGDKPRRVTPMRGNQLTPAISPDGKLIAFACDITGTSDLFIVPFQLEVGSIGKPRHLFSAKGAACASPTFSPDGKRIAFVCNKDGSPKIYVMEVPQVNTQVNAQENIQANAHANTQVNAQVNVKLKSLKPRLISKHCRENSAPCWSPDGKKLAFSGKNSDTRQIWMYDFETGNERQLTRGAGNKENASWANDSLHLVY
ncbi:MAG: hypothetical protein ACRDF4_06455, partial [Rhabdochlamydiaceae bacterium]